MNRPAGFTLLDGRPVDISPLAAMLNPAWKTETVHMTLAAFVATGFAVAGIHAFMLLRNRENLFHRRALAIALSVGGGAAVLLPVSGGFSARCVARHQPAKLAAMEGQFGSLCFQEYRLGRLRALDTEMLENAHRILRALSLLA